MRYVIGVLLVLMLGSVVYAAQPGDCNADGKVDAGDWSAFTLEWFDGDGYDPADAPGGAFPGDPVGCDPNGDGWIDAGDLSCMWILIFGGSCG